MMEKITILSVLVATLILSSTASDCRDGESWFYVTSSNVQKGNCTLNDIGYQPSGKMFGLDSITVESLEMQEDFIDGITGYGEKAIKVAEKAFDGYDNFAEKLEKNGKEVFTRLKRLAPKLASAFGILGLGVELILDTGLSAEQELIDMTNLAFARLSTKINDQMEELKEYADNKMFELEKDMMNRELKTMESFWSNCILETKLHKILQCQKEVSQLFRASSSKFMVYYDLMKTSKKPLNIFQTKRLEVSFVPLRQYVLKNLFVIETLKGLYENRTTDGICSYDYQSSMNASINDMKKFKVYFNWALKNIINVHTHNVHKTDQIKHTNCEKTMKCQNKYNHTEGVVLRDYYYQYNCSCVFDPVLPNVECAIDHTHYLKPKLRGTKETYEWICGVSVTDVLEKRTQGILKPHVKTFIDDFKREVESFWKKQFSYDKIINVLKESIQKIRDINTYNCYPTF